MTPFEFLERWRPDGPWVLTAIGEGSQISTHECHDEADVLAWLEQHAERNHYFHVNDCRGELKKKADRGDIRAVRALHVDVDFEGAGTDDEREAIYRRFDEHRPRPSVLVFSGGGSREEQSTRDWHDRHVGAGTSAAHQVAELDKIKQAELRKSNKTKCGTRFARHPGAGRLDPRRPASDTER